jgi:hypothetical protein
MEIQTGNKYEVTMKMLLFLIFLSITVNLYAVPDNTMTIPTVSDGDTIEASEHNTARNTISSTYNAHSHSDITSLSNLGTVGTLSTGVWNGTVITATYGGTGAATLTDGGILLGSGTGAITAMSVLADGEMIVGDGTTDPVAESGATLRTSIGVAIGTDVQAYDAQLADLADGTLSGSSTVNVGTAATGVLPVANGGTGSTSGMSQLFTSDGNFTVPAGVTTVYITMVGGGGGGGKAGNSSGGCGGAGGGGQAIIKYPYTVTAEATYAVDVGAAGTAGTGGNGGAGANSTFDTTGVVALGGNYGAAGSGGTPGASGAVSSSLTGSNGATVGGKGVGGGAGGTNDGNTAASGGGSVFGIGGAGGESGGNGSAPASGYGGGGGGGSPTTGNGGAGKIGFVLVEW